MAWRASRSAPFAQALPRLAKISLTAAIDSGRVSSLAKPETKDSTACVSASMPVAAVTARGMPVISAASSAAITGTSLPSTIGVLVRATVSVTTATAVTSEPVPAVVGTA